MGDVEDVGAVADVADSEAGEASDASSSENSFLSWGSRHPCRVIPARTIVCLL